MQSKKSLPQRTQRQQQNNKDTLAHTHTHTTMSGMPGNIAPTADLVAPSKLPDGFTLAGPGGEEACPTIILRPPQIIRPAPNNNGKCIDR